MLWKNPSKLLANQYYGWSAAASYLKTHFKLYSLWEDITNRSVLSALLVHLNIH